ncbi:MAG: HAD family hydrolase [Armatimonadota bacterium]
MMKYDAVIFDLFGTLIDNFAEAPFRACLAEMAGVLGVDAGQFIAIWTDPAMIHTRMSGTASTFNEYLALVSERCALAFTPMQVTEARDIRTAYTRHCLTPREGTIAVLCELQKQGYKIGLIANCTWEVPELWSETPFAPLFAKPVFSCAAGMAKPDPRIYHLACNNLGIAPERCVFIGDGSNHELTGARQVGMDAILICAPHERHFVMQRPEPREWTGPVISRAEEVLAYLAEPCAVQGASR